MTEVISGSVASAPALLLIGLFAGLMAGLFGVGGGLIIVPALIYVAGFSAQKATGTSLAVLLPPVGLAAVIEYYKNGNIDFRAAFLVAIALFLGAWAGAYLANSLDHVKMKLLFGGFVVLVGLYTIFEALIEKGTIHR